MTTCFQFFTASLSNSTMLTNSGKHPCGQVRRKNCAFDIHSSGTKEAEEATLVRANYIHNGIVL